MRISENHRNYKFNKLLSFEIGIWLVSGLSVACVEQSYEVITKCKALSHSNFYKITHLLTEETTNASTLICTDCSNLNEEQILC